MSGLLRWMCVLALACATTACGGDDSGEGEGLPMPESQEISADDGGEIETQGASINIPGGALTEDTEVTLEVILPTGQPEADKLASLIYDFGPDGTQFEMPVELTIEMNKSVPEGMDAHMAWLDEDTDKWVPLEDSEVDGMTVTATTTHFTMFAIVLTTTGQAAGSCDNFAEEFEPCGGDIEGTWEFTLGCADLSLADLFGADNEIATCDGVTLAANIDISGTAMFTSDGTYDTDIEQDVDFQISIPLSCLPDGATCSALMSDEPDAPTVTEEDGVCMLAMDPEPMMQTEMGMYELDGDLLIMTEEGEESDEPSEYCVEGNTITVRTVEIDEEDGTEQVFFFQATRQ
jgi:hypothetical protein